MRPTIKVIEQPHHCQMPHATFYIQKCTPLVPVEDGELKENITNTAEKVIPLAV
jgi:hypothetical protein